MRLPISVGLMEEVPPSRNVIFIEHHSCKVSALRLRDTGASMPMVVVSDVLSRAIEALDTSDDALPTEDTNRLLATDWAWRKLPKRVPLSFLHEFK